MANCPKCNHHLRLADWKQKCPYCGANVFLYNLQERLMQDADKAEVQNYHFQKKVDRVKASYAGSPLAITRIVTSLLPIAALFAPLFSVAFADPYADLSGKLDVIGLYKLFGAADPLAFLSDAWAHGLGGKAFVLILMWLVLSLLFLLLHFILLFLSCSPHGRARNLTLDALQVLTAAFFVFVALRLQQGSFVAVRTHWGSALYLGLSCVNMIVDILTFRQGIEIKHKQCYVGGIPIEEYFEMQRTGVPQEEIRAEMYRRLTALQQEKERKLMEETEKKHAEEEAGRKEAENHG